MLARTLRATLPLNKELDVRGKGAAPPRICWLFFGQQKWVSIEHGEWVIFRRGPRAKPPPAPPKPHQP